MSEKIRENRRKDGITMETATRRRHEEGEKDTKGEMGKKMGCVDNRDELIRFY